MASGGTKPERARADRLREQFEANYRSRQLANERLRIRAELKSVGDDEPDTGVVHAEALKRTTSSEPPSKASPLVVVYTVAKKFPPWGAVIVALAAIAAYVALQYLPDRHPPRHRDRGGEGR